MQFDINGHYDIANTLPLDGNFTGTMDVDTTIGQLVSFEVLFPGLATFNDVASSKGGMLFSIWKIGASNAFGDYLALTFSIPQVPTFFGFGRGLLVDFAGGSILGDAVIGSFYGLPFRGFFSGDVTPAQVSVPEPAALGMFGAGVLLLVSLWVCAVATTEVVNPISFVKSPRQWGSFGCVSASVQRGRSWPIRHRSRHKLREALDGSARIRIRVFQGVDKLYISRFFGVLI